MRVRVVSAVGTEPRSQRGGSWHPGRPCGEERLRGMAKRTGADPEVLHRQAQEALLSGLRRGDDVYNLMEAVAPAHVRGRFTPDVAMLELAVTALELPCPPGAEPLAYEGLRER